MEVTRHGKHKALFSRLLRRSSKRWRLVDSLRDQQTLDGGSRPHRQRMNFARGARASRRCWPDDAGTYSTSSATRCTGCCERHLPSLPAPASSPTSSNASQLFEHLEEQPQVLRALPSLPDRQPLPDNCAALPRGAQVQSGLRLRGFVSSALLD